MTPLITTIIPTYKRPKLLKKAIQSVLNQTYPHFQVCIYDNASGDETEEIVTSFIETDSRVKYCRHAENIGMMANYVYALKQVTTKYFSILSDDDLLFPCFYETALENFHRYPEIGFSACSITILREGKRVRIPLNEWKNEGFYPAPLGMYEMIGKFPIPNGVLFQKKVLDKNIEIDSENPIVWDCDFLLQVASSFPIAISKKKCGLFFNHDTSFSTTTGSEQFQLGYLRIIERIQKSELFKTDSRKIAVILLKKHLSKIIFFDGLKKVLEKNYIQSRKNAAFLRSDSKKIVLFLLLLLTSGTCQCFPIGLKLLNIARTFRKKLQRSRSIK